MGYEFYSRVVPKDQLIWLLEINRAGLKFYYDLPIEKRSLYIIEYDFELRHINTNIKK